jgi:integral membrane sensor domain MASE1
MDSEFMTKFTAKQHATRAFIGITCGFMMAIVSAIVAYRDYTPGKGNKWAWLILLALPVVTWACTHLARYRGYPSGAAYGLVVAGFIISGFTIVSRSPLDVGFIKLTWGRQVRENPLHLTPCDYN